MTLKLLLNVFNVKKAIIKWLKVIYVVLMAKYIYLIKGNIFVEI